MSITNENCGITSIFPNSSRSQCLGLAILRKWLWGRRLLRLPQRLPLLLSLFVLLLRLPHLQLGLQQLRHLRPHELRLSKVQRSRQSLLRRDHHAEPGPTGKPVLSHCDIILHKKFRFLPNLTSDVIVMFQVQTLSIMNAQHDRFLKILNCHLIGWSEVGIRNL